MDGRRPNNKANILPNYPDHITMTVHGCPDVWNVLQNHCPKAYQHSNFCIIFLCEGNSQVGDGFPYFHGKVENVSTSWRHVIVWAWFSHTITPFSEVLHGTYHLSCGYTKQGWHMGRDIGHVFARSMQKSCMNHHGCTALFYINDFLICHLEQDVKATICHKVIEFSYIIKPLDIILASFRQLKVITFMFISLKNLQRTFTYSPTEIWQASD